MCSDGDKTAKATEASQAAFTQTLQNSFGTAFAANQGILNNLSAKLTDAINNPKGFSPQTLALIKTNASDTVAQQTKGAQVAAGNYGASHGGADLGSGVQSQIEGSIAGQGAEESAKEQSNIDVQNGLVQNQNYWNAIKGLTDVANAENPTSYAGQATGAANSTADLSRSVLASQQAGWQNTFGIINGVAGLATAAAGLPISFGGSSSGGGTNAPEGSSGFPGASAFS